LEARARFRTRRMRHLPGRCPEAAPACLAPFPVGARAYSARCLAGRIVYWGAGPEKPKPRPVGPSIPDPYGSAGDLQIQPLRPLTPEELQEICDRLAVLEKKIKNLRLSNSQPGSRPDNGLSMLLLEQGMLTQVLRVKTVRALPCGGPPQFRPITS
jgi:hypothetical protein